MLKSDLSDVSQYVMEKLQFLSGRSSKIMWIGIKIFFFCFCDKKSFQKP